VNGQTVIRRMKSDFRLKLNRKQREEFIRWSLSDLPVNKHLVVDGDYRVHIESRGKPHRPRGSGRSVSKEDMVALKKTFVKAHGREPTERDWLGAAAKNGRPEAEAILRDISRTTLYRLKHDYRV
jgi:hypothetical protein